MAIAPERMGIGIHRRFTLAGQDPYETVVWERRDARIVNFATGAVAFEQLGVEVPSTWSLNATNILAQKYFRGTLGEPDREWSLKQVVDRVVDTIAAWGRKDGYFVDDTEAETFSDELKYLIIHQKAAFNSPVWFNIGVKGVPQQGSACQPYDALVCTPDGLVPIGRLVETNAVGTKVYDAHGLTKIVAVKSNGRKPVLRVHTKAGVTLDVTADHLVWRASGYGTGRFAPAGELKVGDQLTWHRRDSWGGGEIFATEFYEAALAGWLQSDGCVGQYEGTNRSLTIEAITVTPDELRWVTNALDRVFPGVHRHERSVETQDPALDCRRTRLYGTCLSEFVEKWGLRARGTDMTVPPHLFDAPLPVVRCYLRSLFQAEGYVSMKERSAFIGCDMISEKLIRGAQQLLARFGIFSRVRFKADSRPDRKGCWSLTIRNAADRRRFADEIGFVGSDKAAKLEQTFAIPGRGHNDVKLLEIDRIEEMGEDDVYDIQTESGEYLSGHLRVHNCFILAVEDSMDSILNWYREEGVIFKGGSGAGVNLSKIRSSKEGLKGGGTASGPVSFMRGADASAGTIKSGGKTRRAAKMVILDAGHPDIQDFIWCKAIEERKARALRDAGFDMDLDGKDSHSIQYQNANNSVRVTDEFMQAVLDDADWHLRAIGTGEILDTVRARDLFRQIAKAAWECADPGMQFDTTINRWHTAPNTSRINASNPCSEYMHIDNSACNLASLNLLTFLEADGSFDVEGFRAATEVVFTAQEIIVGNADYPTENIAENSRRFRQLGIGYANLGALLMAQGLPYDSEEGRAWAAAITALLTGHSYATSARTAARMGPFAGYQQNREPMLDVLKMHRDAASRIDEELVPPELLSAAQESWDTAVEVAEQYGVRNAQASVLAPTGTIGLLMDCDTTGIEPDLGLVKMKKLVGGGTMSIVNQTVPRALTRLGYTDDQIGDIIAYIDEHKSIVGAPHLTGDHLPVFACSMGDNTIHYRGHVHMMGAVQPFISGAISKTVNMPEEATVEDVEQLHIEAWQLGLKAVAIYRDNCKVAQPLATAKKTVADPGASEAEIHDAELALKVAELEQALERQTVIVKRPIRERLPRKRKSYTFAFRVADCEGYVTVGEYDDGRPGEVFMKVSKQGSTLSGIMDAFSISISLGLQHGVPLATFVKKYTNMRFEPAGMTDDPDLRIAQSLVDYIFRRLAVDYLTLEERAELGVLTSAERTQQTLPGIEETVTPNTSLDAGPQIEEPVAMASPKVVAESDAPYCFQCGVQMQRAGSCHACPSCGTTSGCS
ncbi:MAG TPA: vitamin B12-dependent ribonucleotide reductase [Acidimicrobiales bacterium]|nr:vitamin B12-dependent ribonucleotide reductase [Acidimicrobiales bacterium]